ncbi:MAG: S8 family peptidase [Candidatus Solibacter sp.]
MKTFDPVVLDRTVIAIPLLNDMRVDLQRIGFIKDLDPEAIKKYNSALEFNPDFPGGREAASKLAADLIQEAGTKTREVSAHQADQHPQPGQQQRYQNLAAAVDRQKLGEIITVGGTDYQFADLHAAVIRRALRSNQRLKMPPLAHIHPTRFEIIIDLNLEHPQGRGAARDWVLANIEAAKQQADIRDPGQEVHLEKDQPSSQYIFARLEARAIQCLVEMDTKQAVAQAEEVRKSRQEDRDKRTELMGDTVAERPVDATRYRNIFHIWPDFEVSATINKSISTVKANAAQNSFGASGAGITWAVVDSGVNREHPHFATHGNLDKDSSLHRDFTIDGEGPFTDLNGHGTHVAGIIAGEWRVTPDTPPEKRPVAVSRYLKTDTRDVEYQSNTLDVICGMAPQCRLVSLRVLDEDGKGSVSNLIAAITHIQEKNGYGRRLVIHGVNMSLGYNFEPEWFACGQSPLCVEVDRLVKSGVVVVVAAGNTGYGTLKSSIGASAAGMALTINDPGNADLAITVGSTHRDSPHIYGVSYFSSKGPTGDGRLKPDLVAPGEKIISCAAGQLKEEGAKGNPCDYVETSGTSMAAPHVSGVIAAFLSVRGEFIGQAERVKEIFLASATDLRRDRYFQGAGLVDLMRAIQSV